MRAVGLAAQAQVLLAQQAPVGLVLGFAEAGVAGAHRRLLHLEQARHIGGERFVDTRLHGEQRVGEGGPIMPIGPGCHWLASSTTR